MSDAISDYLEARGLGQPERRVPLKGRLDLQGPPDAAVELCLTAAGVFLVAATGAQSGHAVDVLEGDGIRYETAKLADRLRLGDRVLGVPSGRGDEAKTLIAIGRLRRQPGRPPRRIERARHIEDFTEVERVALDTRLEDDELVLAYLRTASTVTLPSPIAGQAIAPERFLLTDRRAARLAVSEYGDTRFVPLEPTALEVSGNLVRAGTEEWKAARNAELFTEIARAAALPAEERLVDVARLNWLRSSGKPERLAFARSLLEKLRHGKLLVAGAAQLLIAAELGEPPASRPDLASLARSLSEPAAAGALRDLWREWGFSVDAGRVLLERLREAHAAADACFELHAALRERLLEQLKNPLDAAIVDIELIEHALAVGRPALARDLAARRLDALPVEAPEELASGNLAAGQAGASLAVRIRLNELLVSAGGTGPQPDATPLVQLARLQPLVVERLEAAAGAAAGSLSLRAGRAAEALGPGGPASRAGPAAPPGAPPERAACEEPIVPLPEPHLLSTLRYPPARGLNLVGSLQGLVAAAPRLDATALRDYCERVDARAQPALHAALHGAARALGVPEVAGYLSRGSKNIGVRAFEASPPIVLIGSLHLDPGEPFWLSPAELYFALGTEVAHLRFGHARVTSSELWQGALTKSRQGIDLVLGVLPMLKGWKVAGRFGQMASQVPTGTVKRALQGASTLNEAVGRGLGATLRRPTASPDTHLATPNEQLVAAHRLMQRTADRAGLLLCGDIRAAIRAMFLVRRDYAAELPAVERTGLTEALAARVEAQDIPFCDLAARIAALVSFSLSTDYDDLRRALRAPGDRPTGQA